MNFVSLALFVIATAGTPGPNNTLVMATGANFGFRKSAPAIMGVNIGFPVMVLIVGLALGGVFERWPIILDVLRPIGIAYLLFLAYKIASTSTKVSGNKEEIAKPLGFWNLALFQFINPKSWVMAISALSAYVEPDESSWYQVLVIALIFFCLGTPCTIIWTLIGVGVGRVVSKPKHFRAFNIIMAGLLVLSLIPTTITTWQSLPFALGENSLVWRNRE